MTKEERMTRKDAIETFVCDHLTSYDLVTVLSHINRYDGSLADESYNLMEDFDDILKGESPMAIARAIHRGIFYPDDEYFKVVRDKGKMALFSANWDDLIDDALDHLVNHYHGDTGFTELDDLIHAQSGALFDENLKEIKPADTPHIA